MASQVTVRELKNETTAILRRVEAGQRVAVTKRGRIIATIVPAAADTHVGPSDMIYQRLLRHIEARLPGMRGRSAAARRRAFERLSEKVARTNRFKDWRDMERAVKGRKQGEI